MKKRSKLLAGLLAVSMTVSMLGSAGTAVQATEASDVLEMTNATETEMLETTATAELAETVTEASDFTYSVLEDGTIEITGYTGEATDVIIPAEIDGMTVTTVSGFYQNTRVTSVVIPEGVTSIGGQAFYRCVRLMSVTLPESLVSIGKQAFFFCTSLTSIEIPENVSSIDVGNQIYNAFSYCQKLTEITVSEQNSYYASYDGVLYNKSMTELLLCPAGKESVAIKEGISTIGQEAFAECDKLTSVIIPRYVRMIESEAFISCENLKEVTLQDGLTTIGSNAFSNCPSLTSIAIPNTVESIGDYAFLDCEALEYIKIPESVTSIGTNICLNPYGDKGPTPIMGYAGSYAQTYAEENGIPFIVIEVEKAEIIGDYTLNGMPVFTHDDEDSVPVKFTYTDGTEEIIYEHSWEDNVRLQTGQSFRVSFDKTLSSGYDEVMGMDRIDSARGLCSVRVYAEDGIGEYTTEQEILMWNLGKDAPIFTKVGQVEKVDGQKSDETQKFLVVCEESGNYILRYTASDEYKERIVIGIENEDGSASYYYLKAFAGFTGMMRDELEANAAMYFEAGQTYTVIVKAREEADISYELSFAKEPTVTDVSIDNESWPRKDGDFNWWGLNGGFPIVVTYSDGSIQHLHGPRDHRGENEIDKTYPYLQYDDYGNYFVFALKDETQEMYDQKHCLIGGEYPVTITVSDGQVYEDVIKIQKNSELPEEEPDSNKTNEDDKKPSTDSPTVDNTQMIPSGSTTINGQEVELEIKNVEDAKANMTEEQQTAIDEVLNVIKGGDISKIKEMQKTLIEKIANKDAFEILYSKLIDVVLPQGHEIPKDGMKIRIEDEKIKAGMHMVMLHMKADGIWENIPVTALDGAIEGVVNSLSPIYYFEIELETAPSYNSSASNTSAEITFNAANGTPMRWLTSKENGNFSISGRQTSIPEGAEFSVRLVSDDVYESVKAVVTRAKGAVGFVAYEMNLCDAFGNAITKFEGHADISMPIPAGLYVPEGNTVTVYCVNNGKLQKCNTVVQDGIVTFGTTHLSTFVYVSETLESAASTPVYSSVASPKTADNSNMSFYVTILGMMALCSMIYTMRKKENR